MVMGGTHHSPFEHIIVMCDVHAHIKRAKGGHHHDSMGACIFSYETIYT